MREQAKSLVQGQLSWPENAAVLEAEHVRETPCILEMHCKNGTRTAFQIRHSSLDVRLHFVCGKGSDAMPPLPACMEHVNTPISQGTSWFWNENKSTKYYYWSDTSCFVSEYLSKDTKRAKMCSTVNVVPCQARLSLVEHAYSCYVHAPTLYFRSNIHNYKYTLTLSIFYVLQILRVLVPISSCFSTVLLTDVLNELRTVTTPGKS